MLLVERELLTLMLDQGRCSVHIHGVLRERISVLSLLWRHALRSLAKRAILTLGHGLRLRTHLGFSKPRKQGIQ